MKLKLIFFFLLVPHLFAVGECQMSATQKIQAATILEEISKGKPVYYNNVIIEGDLDVKKIILPVTNQENRNYRRVIKSPIKIVNSKFQNYVDFNGISFQESIVFERTSFEKGCTFSYVQFFSNANFKESKFEKYSDFRNAHFIGHADFNNAIFAKNADFSSSIFHKNANFEGLKFEGDAKFNNCEFYRYASFERIKFSNNSNFGFSYFDKTADFNLALFGNDATFTGSKFNQAIYLNNVMFYNDIRFDHITANEVQLENICLQSDSILYLNDTIYNDMHLEWDQIKNNLFYNTATYLSMINNFEKTENYKDSDNCYYQYRKERQDREDSIGEKIIDYSAWITCGYGVRPTRTLALSICVVLIFATIYSIGHAVPENAYEDLWVKFLGENLNCFFVSVYYSSMAFVSPDTSIEMRPAGKWKYILLLEHIVGWLLMALFIVTLAKVMIR